MNIKKRYEHYINRYGESKAVLKMIVWLGIAQNSQIQEFRSLRQELINRVAEREAYSFSGLAQGEDEAKSIYEYFTRGISDEIARFSFAYDWATSDMPTAEFE